MVVWIEWSQSHRIITVSCSLMPHPWTPPFTLDMCIHSGSLHHPLNYLIGLDLRGMQINWLNSIFLHLSNLLPSYLLSCVLFCLPFQLASHSDLNTRPARTEPEGESSPPESDQPQRMESAETKDVEQRLTSHTKPDAVPLSPVSPASSVPRSKRKEGKGVVDWIALVYF